MSLQQLRYEDTIALSNVNETCSGHDTGYRRGQHTLKSFEMASGIDLMKRMSSNHMHKWMLAGNTGYKGRLLSSMLIEKPLSPELMESAMALSHACNMCVGQSYQMRLATEQNGLLLSVGIELKGGNIKEEWIN